MDPVPPPISPSTTLHDLLSNYIVLHQIAPYFQLSSLLRLTATSHALRSLLLSNPAALPRLDLRLVRAARLPSALLGSGPLDNGGQTFRAERIDESLTEDEFYCGPLRGIFFRLAVTDVLRFVSTMLLDGLCVPADSVRELIAEDKFAALRTLSVRRCEHLNERKLCQVLRYAVRPSRAEGTPGLRCMYIFGPRDDEASIAELEDSTGMDSGGADMGITAVEGAQIGGIPAGPGDRMGQLMLPEDRWYRQQGEVIKMPLKEWSETLEACRNIIAFDAVLCRGPKHDFKEAGSDWLGPNIAHISLAGCASCGSCPEGPALFDHWYAGDSSAFPLLAPPPLHSTTVKTAQRPHGTTMGQGSKTQYPPLILRCQECLRNRRCSRCNKWWCESCYQLPTAAAARQPNLAPTGNTGAEGTAYWNSDGGQADDTQVKVYLNVCVESCLRSEILSVADGMWG